MSKESINELIQAEAKKLAKEMVDEQQIATEPGESILKIGAKIFYRSVTFHHVGRISYIGSVAGSIVEVRLEDASWVADSGKFSKALNTGSLEELERFPSSCSIFLGAGVDVAPWPHELPSESK